ncbi:MAG TPA: ATP-binding protein, partial [Candidatus Cloacimonadota bacterium]|nr:ATP-binding protein [Candidatus Cloacimonadota bacterium]
TLALISYMRIIKPIRELTRVADLMASWDSKARMPTGQRWEIAQLAEFSNLMLDRMRMSIERHRESRDELHLILSSIEDALWVQDVNGRIELVNPVFKKLFPLHKDEHNTFCWEVIREPEILRIIQEISTEQNPRLSEVSLDGIQYLISASVNRSAGKAIFIMQNIDDIKAAERMKKDFIVNVAHELRTPLTAINGFVDVLSEESDPSRQRYLKIIKNHTARLIALVSDLEDLTKLERSPKLDIQDVNLATFMENIHSLYETRLAESKLQLDIHVSPSKLRGSFDPFRMEQVLINLIDNALRYTERGGITIKLFKAQGKLNIEITDTGSGIEEKHLNRLFERFYTVDQSRSRSRSGTGLGLAIVKHIVQSHGGSISVSSTPDVGTTFLIQLP